MIYIKDMLISNGRASKLYHQPTSSNHNLIYLEIKIMTNNSLFQNTHSVHPSTETDIQSSETATKNSHDKGSQPFGEVIHAYTRAQAIDDGVLEDVSYIASRMGFKFPVAITAAAYDAYVDWNDEDTKRLGYQDSTGRLKDILWMLLIAIRCNDISDEGGLFTFYCIPRHSQSKQRTPEKVQLKALVGPGDNFEPVITIMMPDED